MQQLVGSFINAAKIDLNINPNRTQPAYSKTQPPTLSRTGNESYSQLVVYGYGMKA